MHNESSFNKRIANNANLLPALLVLRLILVFSIFSFTINSVIIFVCVFNSNKKPYNKNIIRLITKKNN